MAGTKNKKDTTPEVVQEELMFEVGDEEFPMENVGISIFVMEFAKAQKRAGREEPHKSKNTVCNCRRCVKVREEREGAGYELLTTMYDCMLAMVKEEYHDELREYLKSAKLGHGVLEEAIGTAMGKLTADSEDSEGNELEESE